MAPTEIEAAVGFVRDHEFEFNGEVPEFVVSYEVVAVKVFVGGVYEDAVFDSPTVTDIKMTEMPASGVFAIEERTEAIFVGGENAEG